jgi:hypothetical protein
VASNPVILNPVVFIPLVPHPMIFLRGEIQELRM